MIILNVVFECAAPIIASSGYSSLFNLALDSKGDISLGNTLTDENIS
jgi:hypothetical protein